MLLPVRKTGGKKKGDILVFLNHIRRRKKGEKKKGDILLFLNHKEPFRGAWQDRDSVRPNRLPPLLLPSDLFKGRAFMHG
jgi:hypothetical protein